MDCVVGFILQPFVVVQPLFLYSRLAKSSVSSTSNKRCYS